MILKHGEKKNPYSAVFHREGCPETIWESESELISPGELRERRCEACGEDRRLWASILKHTADEETDPPTLYGDLANRGFYIHRKVSEFHYPIKKLEAFDYELLLIVQAEIKRREAFHAWERQKETEKANQNA